MPAGYRIQSQSSNMYYPYGSLQPNRYSQTAITSRYGFNGMEKDNELKGDGNSLDFGARIYDSRIGRFLSLDPHASNYASLSDYVFVGNMPINAIDPDGRDIVVLSDPNGAHGAGHQAILIGNNKEGWTYISKDGAVGSNFGSKPKFTIQTFESIEEFRNSAHNFVLADGEYHSDANGNENTNPTFKLDEDGNRIQRFTEAYYIGTTQIDGSSTDAASVSEATVEAKKEYFLGISDCSDVVRAALDVGKNSEGQQLKNGENSGTLIIQHFPNKKQEVIEKSNNGVDYDKGVEPDS